MLKNTEGKRENEEYCNGFIKNHKLKPSLVSKMPVNGGLSLLDEGSKR